MLALSNIIALSWLFVEEEVGTEMKKMFVFLYHVFHWRWKCFVGNGQSMQIQNIAEKVKVKATSQKDSSYDLGGVA